MRVDRVATLQLSRMLLGSALCSLLSGIATRAKGFALFSWTFLVPISFMQCNHDGGQRWYSIPCLCPAAFERGNSSFVIGEIDSEADSSGPLLSCRPEKTRRERFGLAYVRLERLAALSLTLSDLERLMGGASKVCRHRTG